MSKAVSAYRAESVKKLGIKHHGLWTIAKDFKQMNFEATGNYIKLSHATLACLAAGRRSLAEMNAAKSWLSKEETKQVLAYIEEIGNQGFPLSHRRLQEHVDEICHARLSNDFPGVGKSWTHRFIEKHFKHLKTSWSAPLDSKCGRAVNENTNKAWFDLLEGVLDQYDIAEDCIHAVDEIGISPQSGEGE